MLNNHQREQSILYSSHLTQPASFSWEDSLLSHLPLIKYTGWLALLLITTTLILIWSTSYYLATCRIWSLDIVRFRNELLPLVFCLDPLLSAQPIHSCKPHDQSNHVNGRWPNYWNIQCHTHVDSIQPTLEGFILHHSVTWYIVWTYRLLSGFGGTQQTGTLASYFWFALLFPRSASNCAVLLFWILQHINSSASS